MLPLRAVERRTVQVRVVHECFLGRTLLRKTQSILFPLLLLAITAASISAQTDSSTPPPPPREKKIHLKHVLVISQTKGFEHDSVTAGMAAIYDMGRESGLWEAMLRTDVELITKKDLGRNAKNLDYFDAIVFMSTTGELDLDDSQKKDMLSFIKDEGKGFVGIHAALDTNYKWPEYGEMIGGWFDQHPWMTFNAPIINEDPDFPAVRHFPRAFVKFDEIYQPKEWSRDKVHVLLSLDPAKAWSDPDIRRMYFEAIKWVLGMTEGSTIPHARPEGKSH